MNQFWGIIPWGLASTYKYSIGNVICNRKIEIELGFNVYYSSCRCRQPPPLFLLLQFLIDGKLLIIFTFKVLSFIIKMICINMYLYGVKLHVTLLLHWEWLECHPSRLLANTLTQIHTHTFKPSTACTKTIAGSEELNQWHNFSSNSSAEITLSTKKSTTPTMKLWLFWWRGVKSLGLPKVLPQPQKKSV